MPLSWNEIRHNAIRFSKEWAQIVEDRRRDLQGVDHAAERALAQSFWLDFFEAFGMRKELVRSFEVPVKTLSGAWGYIDLFWKRTLLVEHKSPGKNLTKAEQQANDYIQALISNGRGDDVPRYVIVSDFLNLVLEDRRTDTRLEIPLAALHKHIQAFAFLIPSLKQVTYEEQDPINIQAAEVLGKLHDALKDGGYEGRDLEQFLVRILFCLFAEDTGIFELKEFQLYIENHTREDGTDLGARLGHLFEILNTPENKRQKGLPEELAPFPYVNGRLFEERLQFAAFNRAMRDTLIDCCEKDWSLISPAIFGSLFQSIMQPRERRQIGGHYTSERDILKVIRSLFLDDLRAEFEKITGYAPDAAGARTSGRFNVEKSAASDSKITPADLRTVKRPEGRAPLTGARRARLAEFHKKLASLCFFDPACGCGNFLIVTYRELRQLEIEVLSLLYTGDEQELDVRNLAQVDVHQFYGIEIEPWPAHIAEVALWLMDHQMNIQLSKAFGGWYPRIPLKKSPHIVCGNALRLDWKTVLPPAQCSYVLGNPPFVGKHLMNGAQGEDMELVWGETGSAGVLDYVTAWYRVAAEYIQETRIVVSFVSTNSISQGEQVGTLWMPLFQKYHLKIHFGHRTFAWESEARGKAHVHVVIIGFAAFDSSSKRIYDYASNKVSVATAKNISPYLVEGSDMAVVSRSKPMCDVPECQYGNKPTDGGHLIVEEEDRQKFLAENPAAKKYLRPLLCAEEYLYSIPRWCLWLTDASAADIRDIPGIKQRVEAVRDFRLASKKPPTRAKATTPMLFAEIRQPKTRFMVVPQHTSETRKYVPFGYFKADTIVHNSCSAIPEATFFHFGVLSSDIHMAWVRQVCGRIKSDFRYSTRLVYNNFPWPESATDKQLAVVEAKAQAVLAARAEFMNVGDDVRSLISKSKNQRLVTSSPTKSSTLADLYDPLSMPPELVKAHAELDRAVEKCYRPEPFHSDRERVEYLFSLYEKLTAPLLPATPKKRGRAVKPEPC